MASGRYLAYVAIANGTQDVVELKNLNSDAHEVAAHAGAATSW